MNNTEIESLKNKGCVMMNWNIEILKSTICNAAFCNNAAFRNNIFAAFCNSTIEFEKIIFTISNQWNFGIYDKPNDFN